MEKIRGAFFIIDGNRRHARQQLLATLYQENQDLYQKILDKNPKHLAQTIDERIQQYIQGEQKEIPNPDPLSYLEIPQHPQIRQEYIQQLIKSYFQGARAVVETIKHFPADNIIVYGLSLKNLNSRSWAEISPIMNAMLQECYEWIKKPENKHIAIKPVGELQEIEQAGGKDFVQTWRTVEQYSQNNGKPKKTAYILLAYDHAEELKKAALQAATNGGNIDEYLQVPPPIDLIVRTGGEKRLSSGPAYQAQEAEIIFDNKAYWPQVAQDPQKHCERWYKEYTKRHKRHGS